MENLNEKRLFFKAIYIDLKKVNYEKINGQLPGINEQIKVITKDSYEVNDITPKENIKPKIPKKVNNLA